MSFLEMAPTKAGNAADPRPKRSNGLVWLVGGLFVFAVVLCAYIVVAPSGAGQRSAAGSAAVMRAATSDFDTMLADFSTLPAEDAAPSTAQKLAAVAANPSTGIVTDDSDIRDMTAGVLSGLGMQAAQPAVSADDPMFNMTAGVLSSIREVTGGNTAGAAAPVPVPENALQALVTVALREGKSDAYIDLLLNEVAARGEVTVPRGLVTADGRVDTQTLLASIVAEAQVAAGGAAPAVPELVEGEGVEVRVVQTATDTTQYRFYTVAAGDSLGAISVRFYGSVEHFGAIFDANRMILSSPDKIRVGQRLVIPDLT